MSRFTGEEIDKLLGHPGPTSDLPENLLARYERGPRRQPWHQLEEVKAERDRWMARHHREHLRYHEAHDEATRYRTALHLAVEECDR